MPVTQIDWPQFCTVMIMGPVQSALIRWNFCMNHSPGARSLTQSVDLQSSMLPLFNGYRLHPNNNNKGLLLYLTNSIHPCWPFQCSCKLCGWWWSMIIIPVRRVLVVRQYTHPRAKGHGVGGAVWELWGECVITLSIEEQVMNVLLLVRECLACKLYEHS